MSADPPDPLITLKAVLPGYHSQTGRVLLVVNLSNLSDLPSPLSAGRVANGLQIPSSLYTGHAGCRGRPFLRPALAGHARLGTAAAVGPETGGKTALVRVQLVWSPQP